MSSIDFEHKMAAHCETGTIAAMLNHAGMPITEAMVLGVAGGIFFAYLKPRGLPFPTFVTRSRPGDIRKRIAKRLDVGFATKKFGNPNKARADLDALLEAGHPVAVQVDMFSMDYIPAHMKVHFNGHFVAVIGKEDDAYIVSDCYYPQIARVPESSIQSGRFARGELAPKGLRFYAKGIGAGGDLSGPIFAGINEACWNMLKLPIPFLGVKGIRLFAKKLPDWPKLARDEDHLSHQIMMINVILEERGTGGAGFRFMYASFLQQAADLLGNDDLRRMSKEMMGIGDRWREISLKAARIGKNRDLGHDRLKELSAMINDRADEEQKFFTELWNVVKR